MQTCESCRFAEWKFTKNGDLRKDVPGVCTYKIGLPVLPSSVKSKLDLDSLKSPIWVTDKGYCPCHF